MVYRLVIRSHDDEPIYSRPVAAQLAQVSLNFLRLCERENLIQVRVMTGGREGYSVADIRRLTRIYRLREDLGLDLPCVEVVLNLRRQVLELMSQVDEMERQMARREQELMDEIRQLRRRLAKETGRRW